LSRFPAFLSTLVGLSLAGSAVAQPKEPDGEDLEVPAAPGPGAPTPAPGGTPSGAPSATPPASEGAATDSRTAGTGASATPGTSPPSPSPLATPLAGNADTVRTETSAENRIAELERRLLALEARAAESARGITAERPGERLDRTPVTATNAAGFTVSPYSVPVPSGLSITGYVQADYLHSQASQDQLQQTNVVLNQNRFYLRRARLRVDQGWQFATATLDLDANTVNGPVVGIRRAEGSLFYQGSNPRDLPPLLMITAGVTDLPFGYDLFESDRTAPFTERSLVSQAIYPTKQDAGVKVSGALSFLRYAVMVSNGEPVDAKGFPHDPNDAKDVTGRLGVVVPVRDRVEVTGGASFAQGKGFHAGKAATKGGIQWSDQNENGLFDPGEVATTFPTAQEPSKNYDRWAFGLDLGFRLRTSLGESHLWGEVIAASNYDRGFLASDPVAAGAAVRQLGGYAAFTQDVTKYGIVGFRVSVYDPNADVFETRHGTLEPRAQTVRTLSPMFGLNLPGRARFVFEYDFVHDYLGRDAAGVPTDAKNDVYIGRLQVDL
jgi:hypothetical protein